jgi:anti-sigma regulatory factor (Ser/Thr protein kinase)
MLLPRRPAGGGSPYLRGPRARSSRMSSARAFDSAAVLRRSREHCERAARLRRQAVAQRERTEDLCERLVENLLRSSARPFGDRGACFVLRLGRLRPLVRFVRHDLCAWLEQRDVPEELVNDVLLACSEVCANAVEHPREAARQLIEIEARCVDGALELRVRDFGSWSEHAGSEVRGRGLHLVAQLMDTLDVVQRGDGTEIIMRRSLSREDGALRSAQSRGISV